MEKYEHRKAKRVIVLTDSTGKRASGKQVKVKLKNHKFMFGCGAFDVLAYTDFPDDNDKLRRAEMWEALFNYGTLPFYWGRYEVQEGHTRKENVMKCVDRLCGKNIKVKGHPLVEAITGWDFTDGALLNAPSGLIRRDYSPKPAYHMLNKLIHEEWSTEYTAVTDENSCFELNGYKGDYEIVVDGRSFIVSNFDNPSKELHINL